MVTLIEVVSNSENMMGMDSLCGKMEITIRGNMWVAKEKDMVLYLLKVLNTWAIGKKVFEKGEAF